MNKQKQIYVDIDDTICYYDNNNSKKNYNLAMPKNDNIKKVNKLYDLGHIIVLWTARGTLSQINWFNVTHMQMTKWGVKFHELRMNKPAFDILIDDKALNSISHWTNENVNNILNK